MDPWYFAFGFFALSMSASPGPNNVMMTASGANFGFRRSLPHMVGVAVGFPVMLISVGLGFGALLSVYPAIQTVLQIIGSLYLLFLAWRIANAGRDTAGARPRRPMRFFEAAAFQWLNPKAWLIAVGALGTYVRPDVDLLTSLLLMSALFVLACLPSVALWTVMGMGVDRLLTSDRALRAFNVAMAGLLVASLAMVFL